MKINTKIILIFLTVAVLTATVCYLFLFFHKSQSAIQKVTDNKSLNISEKKYIQLLFVGDLMFDRGIRYYAKENNGNDFIFDKISSTLLANDIVVANLEGPITDNKSVSSGTVPGSTDNYFFTFDPSLAKTLFSENIRIVNLGNNHILNFGQNGAYSTEKYLNDAKVKYFGAPNGSKSISTEIGGIKITFVSYNEFSNLPEGTEQKSTMDEIQKATLRRAQGENDIIIVFSHWGTEYSLAPSDNLKNTAHSFIDAGADLVIGSHQHVVEPMEVYNNKRIYYSLGNFIFDQYFNENVRNGLGVQVVIDKITKKLDFQEKHFYLDSNGQTVENKQ
ncbi:MAG: CapA family protein [Candidatus Staskawiczbacteria bacterium]|nr:CapA family protein [Candidatus Staskawiczbacteria bacterium]